MMKKTIFYVGLFLALLVGTNSVFAQQTNSDGQDLTNVASSHISGANANPDAPYYQPVDHNAILQASMSNVTRVPMGTTVLDFNGGNTAVDLGPMLSSIGFTVTSNAGSAPGDLATAIMAQPYDLVIARTHSDPIFNAADVTALSNYIAGGGKVIFSFWNLDGDPGLQAALDVASAVDYSTPMQVEVWDSGHPIFTTPNMIANIPTNGVDSWADDGDLMEPTAGGIALAGFTPSPTAGQAGIILGNSGNTFVNGFTSVHLDMATYIDLIENQAEFLFAGTVANTPPMITCPADIMTGTDPGVCGAVVNFAGVATDAEDGNISSSIVSSPFNSGDEFPVGTTTVTLMVTDSGGLSASCTFDVTVTDTEAPTMTCPVDITQTNDPGECGAIVTYDDPVIMDNCPVGGGTPGTQEVLFPTENSSFTGSARGYIFTAPVDFTITGLEVPDDTSTQPQSIQVMRFASIPPPFSATGPYDELLFHTGTDATVGYIPVSIPVMAGDIIGILGVRGNNRNSYTTQPSIDIDGNTVSIQRLLTQNPINTGPAPQGSYSTEPSFDNKSRVNFQYTTGTGGLVQTAGLPSGSFFPVGTTTNTFVYTDSGGNSATCSFDVTVTDDEAPMITCAGEPTPTTNTVSASPGAPFGAAPTSVSSVINITEDEIITDLNVDLDISHTWVGDVIVELTAPDGTSAVIVDRPGDPAVPDGCAGDDILATLDDEATNPIEDECGAGTPTISGSFTPNNPLSVFDGMSTLGDWTLTVTDAFPAFDDGTLNAWGLTYEYTSSSNGLDVVLDANGMATVDVADLLLDFSDNCGVASTTVQGGGGPMPGALTTTFAGGNGIRSMMFDVNMLTDITIDSFVVNLDDGAVLDIEVYAKLGTHVGFEGDASAWTLIGEAPGTVSAGDGQPTPLGLALDYMVGAGETHAFYIAAPNKAANAGFNYTNGTAVGDVFVSDANMEILEGSSVIYPFTGTIFSPRIFNGTIEYTAGGGSMPVSTFDVDCEDVGENTIEVTVTDVNGNVSTCTATYNVIDDIDPVLVCQNFTLELGPDGTAVLDPFDMIDLNASLEACGISVAAADIVNFTCDDIGDPIEITLFGADPSGNAASCTAFLTVVDALAPEVTCPADQTVDPGANNQLYLVPDYFGDGLASAVDNCTDPVTIFAQDPPAGALIGDGVYTVTLSATDEYGNVGTCTFELTVESILGVNENNLDLGITMYPNPAQGQVTIANNTNINLERLTMYDVNGKLVNTTDLSNMQGEQTIDIANLASGVYIVQIESQDASIVKRLIKE